MSENGSFTIGTKRDGEEPVVIPPVVDNLSRMKSIGFTWNGYSYYFNDEGKAVQFECDECEGEEAE